MALRAELPDNRDLSSPKSGEFRAVPGTAVGAEWARKGGGSGVTCPERGLTGTCGTLREQGLDLPVALFQCPEHCRAQADFGSLDRNLQTS